MLSQSHVHAIQRFRQGSQVLPEERENIINVLDFIGVFENGLGDFYAGGTNTHGRVRDR